MKKSLFIFLTFVLSLTAIPVFSQSGNLHFVEKNGLLLPQGSINPEDDVLDAGSDIKPLEKQMSESEQLQEDSSDFDYIDEEQELPDVSCDSENLKKQVKAFVLNNLNQLSTHSVREKRRRILLVKNLSDFVDVTDKKLEGRSSFDAASVSAYLRINQKRTIKHICKSQNDDSDKRLKSLYIVIYQYLNYYKVVVTNLVPSAKEIDKATFIYNW